MGAVFQDITNLRTAATESYANPVSIKTANTELSMQNSYVSATYVAGIYKDGKNLERLTIEGRRIFATSITDAIAGQWGEGYGIPDPALYTMSGDGEYSVVIRSGKPLSDDGTVESTLARRENVYFFILDLITDYLPIKAKCRKAVLQGVVDVSKGLVEKKETLLANAKSPGVFAGLTLAIASEMFGMAYDIANDCTGLPLGQAQFAKGISDLFGVISIATNFMVYGNVISHTNDLFQAKAAIDTCFQVVGLKTFKCGEQPVYLTEIVSGNNQKGQEGKALPAPLVVKVKTEDGKPAIKVSVSWKVKSGGGTVSLAETETTYDGIAQVTWVPGKGEQQVESYVNKGKGSTTAIFKATTFDGNDRKVEIASGNSQNGQYGRELANPLTVRVLDGEGKPAADVEVRWNILAGGGSFTNRRHLTDAQGMASATWVLGPSGGQNVEVIVKKKDGTPATGSPLVFTASTRSSNLKELIVGKWLLVRETGFSDGIWFDTVPTGIFQLIFGSDGSLQEIINDDVYSGGYYSIDEQKDLLKLHDENNNLSNLITIRELTDEKLVLGWRDEDNENIIDSDEYVRVKNGERVPSVKMKYSGRQNEKSMPIKVSSKSVLEKRRGGRGSIRNKSLLHRRTK